MAVTATREEVLAAIERRKAEGNMAAANRLIKTLNKRSDMSRTQGAYEDFLRGLKDQPAPDREYSAFENMRKGLGAGFVNTLESAALGLATPLEEETELEARKKIQAVADKFTPEGGNKDSVLYNLFSGLGSIGATGVATIGGGLVGGVPGALAAGTTAGVATQVLAKWYAVEL
jgi:hypothetical protein